MKSGKPARKRPFFSPGKGVELVSIQAEEPPDQTELAKAALEQQSLAIGSEEAEPSTEQPESAEASDSEWVIPDISGDLVQVK